jgi:hypothetical protein
MINTPGFQSRGCCFVRKPRRVSRYEIRCNLLTIVDIHGIISYMGYSAQSSRERRPCKNILGHWPLNDGNMKNASLLEKSKKIDKTKVICIAICFVVLAVGLMPYLFIRTSSTYISSFLGMFFHFQRISLGENGLLYILLTSFFSDFCWAFAMPFALFAFTNGRFSKYFYILTMPIIGSVFELFQFFGVIDGVGDIIDAFIYFSASFLGYIIIERGITNGKQA